MKLSKKDLAGIPGATKRRGILIELAIDLLINVGEEVFERVIANIRKKRAAKQVAKAQETATA